MVIEAINLYKSIPDNLHRYIHIIIADRETQTLTESERMKNILKQQQQQNRDDDMCVRKRVHSNVATKSSRNRIRKSLLCVDLQPGIFIFFFLSLRPTRAGCRFY